MQQEEQLGVGRAAFGGPVRHGAETSRRQLDRGLGRSGEMAVTREPVKTLTENICVRRN